MTHRSKLKTMNTTLIALLSLHLFPTGPPYNSTQWANFGNPHSSNSKHKSSLKIHSKTMIKSMAIKILDTMKQADTTKWSLWWMISNDFHDDLALPLRNVCVAIQGQCFKLWCPSSLPLPCLHASGIKLQAVPSLSPIYNSGQQSQRWNQSPTVGTLCMTTNKN